ncbi:general stress protein [Paenibacillus sp. FSL F4-0243]|uniref:general stress protein n=1 Tax=Paenibacillus sp. FSL F4-0243 TaxID=2954732 RepID=UPI0030D92A5B
MTKKIVGIFDTEQEATRAIEGLHNQGFSNEEISVITRDRDELRHISDDTGTKAPEGVATGAATGGVLGGVTGLLAGIGALAIPGIGPILAAGPIVATLTGVAVGAGAGGLVGGLIGLGIPEDEAKEYEGYVESGKILVLVEDNGRGYQAHDVFRDNRSLNAQRYEGVYNEDTRLGNSMANRADRTAEVYNRDKI